MNDWYIMDALRNVSGPHALSWIKGRVRKGPNFWVGQPGGTDWVPADHIREEDADAIELKAPQSGAESKTHLLERGINELIGLCKGIIADGKVDPNEAKFLRSWLENNQQVADLWPANVLQERLVKIFSDGIVDEQEQEELTRLLARFTGGTPGVSDAEPLATRLPLDDPEPKVEFKGKSFCFTGILVMGSKARCRENIEERGGIYHNQPQRKTDYLVIGALGSPFWTHSTHGEKVELVLANRESGGKTAIVSEEHWTFYLDERVTAPGPA